MSCQVDNIKAKRVYNWIRLFTFPCCIAGEFFVVQWWQNNTCKVSYNSDTLGISECLIIILNEKFRKKFCKDFFAKCYFFDNKSWLTGFLQPSSTTERDPFSCGFRLGMWLVVKSFDENKIRWQNFVSSRVKNYATEIKEKLHQSERTSPLTNWKNMV